MKRSVAAMLMIGLLGLALPAAQNDEPKKLKPINLAMNTKADEDDPNLSPDGLQLFYVRNVEGKEGSLMVSERRTKNHAWPDGKPLDDLNSAAGERSPCLIAPGGKYPHYLYFATKKDESKKGGKGDNFDIYFAVKQGAQADFTTATPIHSVCSPADELHPWVTNNGRELFFSRRGKDGWEVWVAPRPDGTGAFEKPKKLDLPPNFHHATLSPDGLTMYLQGPLEKERWGLFRCNRSTTKAEWSKPEPLDELNCPEAPTGDRSPCLSRDGSMLYFASDRPDGKGGLDLWVIPTVQLGKK
jgi:Tol biopolymer transport system component